MSDATMLDASTENGPKKKQQPPVTNETLQVLSNYFLIRFELPLFLEKNKFWSKFRSISICDALKTTDYSFEGLIEPTIVSEIKTIIA